MYLAGSISLRSWVERRRGTERRRVCEAAAVMSCIVSVCPYQTCYYREHTHTHSDNNTAHYSICGAHTHIRLRLLSRSLIGCLGSVCHDAAGQTVACGVLSRTHFLLAVISVLEKRSLRLSTEDVSGSRWNVRRVLCVFIIDHICGKETKKSHRTSFNCKFS